VALARWRGRARTGRWRAALGDRRLAALLGVSIVASLALALTPPLSGRAGLLLGWSILVYAAAIAFVATRAPAAAAPAPAAPAPLPRPEAPYAQVVKATADALHKLGNPAALGECALVEHLPATLKWQIDRQGGVHTSRHQALRALLVEAIDRLKAREGEQTLYHAILHEEYVQGHPTARIMTRHAISESTFHRYRRDAIRAVALDLTSQEEALGRSGAGRA
jgi:hypothetical protein